MRLTLLVIVSFIVSGCAATTWTNDYKNTQEFYADLARCEAMSNSAGYGGQVMYGNNAMANTWNQNAAMSAANSRNSIFTNCMMGEGWRVEN